MTTTLTLPLLALLLTPTAHADGLPGLEDDFVPSASAVQKPAPTPLPELPQLELAPAAKAAAPRASRPYFRILSPLEEIKTGVFLKLGTPVENVNVGAVATIIKHDAADGYLLIPGVGWSLLDVGGFAPPQGGPPNLVLGPSVDLSEPVKSVLRWGLKRVGLGGTAATALLQPAKAEDPWSCAASIGPSWALDPGDLSSARQMKGYFILHAGLAAKWNGKKIDVK